MTKSTDPFGTHWRRGDTLSAPDALSLVMRLAKIPQYDPALGQVRLDFMVQSGLVTRKIQGQSFTYTRALVDPDSTPKPQVAPTVTQHIDEAFTERRITVADALTGEHFSITVPRFSPARTIVR